MLYFKQEKDYTCGCASLRMAMSNFILYRFLPTEAELEKEMGTNDRIGTHPDAIIAAAEKRGFLAKKGEGASFEDIQAMMSDGWIVMLMISVDVPHVVVVQEINPTHIFFKDPYFGDRLARDKKKFISEKQTYPNYRWKVLDKETKKYLPDYDFTSIESVRGWIAIKK
jgi:predicted double-glycine peptidase